METKVVSPKTLFYNEGTTSLNKIIEYSDTAVKALLNEVDASGIEATGPMEFIYYGVTNDPEKQFILQIGLPVKEKKPSSENFKFKTTSPFKCVSYKHKGDVSRIPEVYENLFQQLDKEQLQPKDEIREVYVKWEHLTSANNITEIQIGI